MLECEWSGQENIWRINRLIMADHPSQNGGSRINNVNQPGVLVIGNQANINFGAPGTHPLRDLSPSENGSPPKFSDEEELNAVNKVSKLIRSDYSNKYRKVNRNPSKEQQTPLTRVFLEPKLELTDCCCETVKNCSMYNVFDASKVHGSPTRVLLYGKAFIGKSILCQKYVFDWAEGSQPDFPSFKIVILLKLSQAQGTLEECLEKEIFCKRLDENEKAMFFSYMNKHPEEFLFLLDGVDECNLDELTNIEDFLLDKVYRGVYLIATVRLELNDKLLEISKAFHCRYRIAGYSEDNVLKFISKYFDHDEKKRETSRDFLESNSDFMELPWIPLVTLVMCEFWDDNKENLLTMTKLLRCYTDVVPLFYKYKFVKKEIRAQVVFSTHQNLAVSAMTEDQTQFTQDTLTHHKVDHKVGFLCADPRNKSYGFAHRKLQEYFAARQKVENWDLEELKGSLGTIPAPVLIFIAGLLAEKKDRRLLEFLEMLTISLSGTFFQDSCFCDTMDLFLACVAEAWDKQTSKAILDLCKGFEPFKGTKSPNGFPLQMSHGAAHGLALIVRGLRVLKLNLNAIIISPSEARVIASKCLQGNSMLKSIKFSHSFLCSEGVKTVCAACASMPKLEELDLSCSHFGNEGLQAVADLIKHGQHGMKSLQLDNHLEVNCLKKVHSARHKLIKQDSLTTFESFTKFQEKCKTELPNEEAIKALIEAIAEEGSDIVDISLPACVVGTAVKQWLEVFRRNTELQRIKIHLKDLKGLNESVQDDLIEVVNNMPHLKQMSVVVEDEESNRKDYENHHSLAERTGDKIRLTVSDHTHSQKYFCELFTRFSNEG